MTKTKILYCSTNLASGGEFSLLERTFCHLDRDKFEPIVCSIRSPELSPIDISKKLDCQVFDLHQNSRLNVPLTVYRLARFIRNSRANLVLAGFSGTEREIFLACMIARVPLIGVLTTDFDPVMQSPNGELSRIWRLRLMQNLFGVLARVSSANFVALSDRIKYSASRYLHLREKNIEVIPPGLVPDDYLPGPDVGSTRHRIRQELGIADDATVLVNVGRLSLAKGQEDLIRAMPAVLRAIPDAELLIAGGGNLHPRLAEIAEETGVTSRVHLLGSRSDVVNILHGSDVFVMSSYFEGVPHAVIEAMASRLPVVAFEIPALIELIEHGQTGLLVKNRDGVALATEIANVVERNERNTAMVARAADIVNSTYDIRENIRLLEGFCSRLARPSCGS